MTPATDIATQRRMGYEIAEAIAPTWEQRREQIETIAAPMREWLVDRLDPQRGDTILELAAGTGDTGFETLAAIGMSGRLICTDVSPRMVDAARRRGEEIGARNVEFRTMDAEQIELDDDSVDGVICRIGYMLFPDPAQALAQTRRVLRPGGRLVFALWGPPERNPFFTTAMAPLVQAGHLEPRDPDAPGVFRLSDQVRAAGLVQDAGFDDVEIEPVEVRLRFPSIQEYVDMVADTAGPIALALQRLSPGEREAVEKFAEGALERHRTEDGYELPGLALCGVAR